MTAELEEAIKTQGELVRKAKAELKEGKIEKVLPLYSHIGILFHIIAILIILLILWG